MPEYRSTEDRCKAEALRIYKARALERGLVFTMDDDDFFYMIDEPCFYCGAVKSRHTTVVSGRWRYTYRHNGIDRVNDEVGYNCVACCIRCNRSKGKMREDEWLDWIVRIAILLREREPNRPLPEPEIFGDD